MRRYKVVVIGTSWGGLKAVSTLLEGLPREFPLPVVIVQHRSRESDDTLCTVLQRATALRVRDCEDKEQLVGGSAYVGPADYHLLIEAGAVALSTDDAVAFSRPSIDVLFESAAAEYGEGVIAILLTGANADGARGLVSVRRVGGYSIAQDPATAESPTMPQAGVATGCVDKVLPLEEIAPHLIELARAGSASPRGASVVQP